MLTKQMSFVYTVEYFDGNQHDRHRIHQQYGKVISITRTEFEATLCAMTRHYVVA